MSSLLAKRNKEESSSVRAGRPLSSSPNDERVNLILIDSSGKDVYFEYLPSYVSTNIGSLSEFS
jgi:hypothetical protein